MRRKAKGLIEFIKTRPYLVIEGIASLSIFLFGVFLISPLYSSVAGATVGPGAYILGTNIGITLFLASCIIPPLFTLFGAVWRPFTIISWKIRSWAMLGVFYGYMFTSILWILVAGLVPVTWVFTFALSLIAAVVYLRIKWELHNR
jgi:hypothetical protein